MKRTEVGSLVRVPGVGMCARVGVVLVSVVAFIVGDSDATNGRRCALKSVAVEGVKFDCKQESWLRIISGSLRGRALGKVPEGVRPTTDRVRESLFSALGDIEGERVLDLFAGTGALGLEAYSRGAGSVVFVERSKRTARALKKRFEQLGLETGRELRLLETDARRAIKRLSGRGKELDAEVEQFDLVFLDPPYEEGAAESEREPTLEALFASGLLSETATVVVEGPTRHPLRPLPGIRIVTERRYGDTTLSWVEATA